MWWPASGVKQQLTPMTLFGLDSKHFAWINLAHNTPWNRQALDCYHALIWHNEIWHSEAEAPKHEASDHGLDPPISWGKTNNFSFNLSNILSQVCKERLMRTSKQVSSDTIWMLSEGGFIIPLGAMVSIVSCFSDYRTRMGVNFWYCKKRQEPGILAPACNFSAGEAVAGGLWVQGELGLQMNILSQTALTGLIDRRQRFSMLFIFISSLFSQWWYWVDLIISGDFTDLEIKAQRA